MRKDIKVTVSNILRVGVRVVEWEEFLQIEPHISNLRLVLLLGRRDKVVALRWKKVTNK